MYCASGITWDQALLLLLFCFFGSRGKKNNAWNIHLPNRQPPPNLHNLTSAWPVMLLANQRLPDVNQILARMCSLSFGKSILRKRKFLSTSMFRWRFLKKIFEYVFFLWWNTAICSSRTFIQQLQKIKEFTGKSSLTVLCRKQWKKIGWCTILHELKRAVKAKIAQNNSQLSEGGITVKPGQDSIHKLIIWKVNPFVAAVTCSQYQIVFKWSIKVLTATF